LVLGKTDTNTLNDEATTNTIESIIQRKTDTNNIEETRNNTIDNQEVIIRRKTGTNTFNFEENTELTLKDDKIFPALLSKLQN